MHRKMLEGYIIYQMVISGYLWFPPPLNVIQKHDSFYQCKKMQLILKAMLVGLPVALAYKHRRNDPAWVSEPLPPAHALLAVTCP